MSVASPQNCSLHTSYPTCAFVKPLNLMFYEEKKLCALPQEIIWSWNSDRDRVSGNRAVSHLNGKLFYNFMSEN